MISVVAFVLLSAGRAVTGERHSLSYIYTAFSRPVSLPGLHEFTALGLLDDRIIDYFDSETRRKVPKQLWMEERLDASYWERGTKSRQSKQEWFRVNTDILMSRMRHNGSDLHVLQWKHGCEADVQPDGAVTFRRGVDMYSYDGDDFLYFDDANKDWVAPVDAARETKRKWDVVQVLKDYTVGYLENECVQWLQVFLNYSQEQLRSAPPPEVYFFAKKSRVETNLVLTCLATGFYPRSVDLTIRMDGRALTREDGVASSGVRPNGDGTYQKRDHVEIRRKDKDAEYVCELVHGASGLRVETAWDRKVPQDGTPPWVVAAASGASVALLLLLVFLIVFLFVHPKWVQKKPVGAGAVDPSSTNTPLRKVSDPSLSRSDSGVGSRSSSQGSRADSQAALLNEREQR
ncbi:H-2 class I histocompatibility antigen, Q10 alpha chain-like isoform X2 [Brachionichthys hirsutus]|uniref:H-2 class I histocompatibility antigen, Q10 alpha chain-like isoform X2 n=1 Tax=Brachionichthys hirsutus TaxID=412623 RepID=UPI003604C9E0